jgi:hypothetical protein
LSPGEDDTRPIDRVVLHGASVECSAPVPATKSEMIRPNAILTAGGETYSGKTKSTAN